ncbi:MAG: hypothetical protein A2103_05275 [Gammaproteobacteria bacterium GWF2_41_13]|nr:MAG: hypothetical protein A2103_05275 [Gammaproteobacteria bacterium GWF2_41_13]
MGIGQSPSTESSLGQPYVFMVGRDNGKLSYDDAVDAIYFFATLKAGGHISDYHFSIQANQLTVIVNCTPNQQAQLLRRLSILKRDGGFENTPISLENIQRQLIPVSTSPDAGNVLNEADVAIRLNALASILGISEQFAYVKGEDFIEGIPIAKYGNKIICMPTGRTQFVEIVQQALSQSGDADVIYAPFDMGGHWILLQIEAEKNQSVLSKLTLTILDSMRYSQEAYGFLKTYLYNVLLVPIELKVDNHVTKQPLHSQECGYHTLYNLFGKLCGESLPFSGDMGLRHYFIPRVDQLSASPSLVLPLPAAAASMIQAAPSPSGSMSRAVLLAQSLEGSPSLRYAEVRETPKDAAVQKLTETTPLVEEPPKKLRKWGFGVFLFGLACTVAAVLTLLVLPISVPLFLVGIGAIVGGTARQCKEVKNDKDWLEYNQARGTGVKPKEQAVSSLPTSSADVQKRLISKKGLSGVALQGDQLPVAPAPASSSERADSETSPLLSPNSTIGQAPFRPGYGSSS